MSKYQFTTLTTDLDNVQKLDDLPNAVGGLSAAQLKAVFDKAGDDIKTFINTVLLAELESKTAGDAGAYKIGVEPIVGLTGVTNVHDAISALLDAFVTGTLPPGGVDTANLADGAVTTPKLGAKAVTTAKIDDGAVTNTQCDCSAGLTVAGDLTQQGKIILDSDCYGETLPAAGTAGRIFFKKVV